MEFHPWGKSPNAMQSVVQQIVNRCNYELNRCGDLLRVVMSFSFKGRWAGAGCSGGVSRVRRGSLPTYSTVPRLSLRTPINRLFLTVQGQIEHWIVSMVHNYTPLLESATSM